tara:strand:+ start:4269 stop:4535 length:267 start_codon:yes stop_codon:yes gene_type:complete
MNDDVRYNANGYPYRITIKQILAREGIDISKLTFCADYGKKRAGILWKAHSIDDSMQDVIAECEAEFIDVGRVKFFGQIHSIWFKQKK